MEITLGRIVHYRLSAGDCEQIRSNRADIAGRHGNSVSEGDVYPMLVARVWSPSTVNGQVLLDGNDSLWVTSRVEGGEPGNWFWPPRA